MFSPWLVYLARLINLLVADTSFVLASRPPHQAESDEIHKDNQAFVDRTISRIPLLAGPLIYGLSLAQLCYELSTHSSPDGMEFSWELMGASGMLQGGQLRLWCYRVLGRFFTFNLAIRKDHKLITEGPYSIIRHPSYTGILIMSISLAARYTNASSFLHLFLPDWLIRMAFWSSCVGPTYFLVKRIRQEEAMLAREFGDEWTRYTINTWRLVPYVCSVRATYLSTLLFILPY